MYANVLICDRNNESVLEVSKRGLVCIFGYITYGILGLFMVHAIDFIYILYGILCLCITSPT